MGAFNECKSLKAIVLPNSVTNIEDYAFQCCESLEYVAIPDSVVNIGYHAFDECKSLNSITFQGTIAQWKKNTKNEDWCDWHLCVVHCTDGDVEM